MIRVVVGEDQPIFKNGIVHVLTEAGFDVAGTAGDAHELARVVRATRPDVLVSDIQMPPDHGDDGLRAALDARRSLPGLSVLLLSQFLDDQYAMELVGDNARGVGYLLKEKVADIATFTDAVKRVAAGETVLDPEVVAVLVGRRRVPGPMDDLTKRELEVLAQIAEGQSNAGIGLRLFISVGAVERHIAHIYGKLGLRGSPEEHRRVLAVLQYLKQ